MAERSDCLLTGFLMACSRGMIGARVTMLLLLVISSGGMHVMEITLGPPSPCPQLRHQLLCRFAKEGYAVALLARSQESLKPVEEAITKAGGKAISIPTDVGALHSCAWCGMA